MVCLSDEELFSISSQGYFLLLQGKSDAARIVFEGLVAIDPSNAYYYRALGAIYWRLKEPQRAVRPLTFAVRVAPREVSSYVNRAESYILQKLFVSFHGSKTQFRFPNAYSHYLLVYGLVGPPQNAS